MPVGGVSSLGAVPGILAKGWTSLKVRGPEFHQVKSFLEPAARAGYAPKERRMILGE